MRAGSTDFLLIHYSVLERQYHVEYLGGGRHELVATGAEIKKGLIV